MRRDLDKEYSRRKDLEDDLSSASTRLSEIITQTNANTKAISKIVQVLQKDGEHSDSNRILVVKKRQMGMRQFFQHFVNFQNHFVANNGIVKISSAGPIWQIETKGPGFTQAIKDSVMNWTNQQQMQVAVIRGKSNISELRERVCLGGAESIAQVLE